MNFLATHPTLFHTLYILVTVLSGIWLGKKVARDTGCFWGIAHVALLFVAVFVGIVGMLGDAFNDVFRGTPPPIDLSGLSFFYCLIVFVIGGISAWLFRIVDRRTEHCQKLVTGAK
jgi:hypothetical protein